jgi:hypothetical protein
MQTHPNHHLILDKHDFREVMKEAKELIQMAKRFKYNLMHEHSIELYNLWAPYVLDDIPSSHVEAPGYKIAFVQVMSIVLAMKGEKEDKSDIKNKFEERKNVINFLAYKSNKNSKNIYQTTNIIG